jgi:ankyrin repeat protein
MKSQLIAIVAAVLVVGCGDPNGALAKALSPANIEAAKQAIADGADVNEKEEWADGMGWTHLYTATVFGHKEIIELLIAAGADVNAQDVLGSNKGKTPLNAANEENHTETADLLRKHSGKTGEELKAEGK